MFSWQGCDLLVWDLQSLCHLTACVPAAGAGTTCLLVLHKCFAPGHTASQDGGSQMQRLTGHSLLGPDASPIPLLLPPTPSCVGQPLPGAWVPWRPPQRRGNSRGSLGLAAGRCLPSKPTSALAGCVFRRVIALSGSRCLYAEIRAGLPLPPALGCGEDDSCHSQRVVGS